MRDTEYFSHLYEIASDLNKEFSLHAALRKALEKTVNLLNLETGWIWLVQADVKSVYLAASYNLPPALSDHPERLSGWCYCIEKYLSDHIAKARNISEISCSRLKNIKTGTRELKFHATIPITTGGQKVGLINLVSKEIQQLNDTQLSILNTISELIGMAIQRTRLQESYTHPQATKDATILEVLNRILSPRLETLIIHLQEAIVVTEKTDISSVQEHLHASLTEAINLQEQLLLILHESSDPAQKSPDNHLKYPGSPLTNRELELLLLVKKGFTNKQIADQLFISERTVKFHMTSIMSKLYAGTRTEAVDIALKRGLLTA
ncbi:GAF domain-containing protein [Rhodocytophaga rosea]|uniref:GAF domain-containing protein n=1 Tax=Rhodocytophaga rosea TaxID=2704465 RepID=A0A6C0GPH2_9BACT|nr:LuxR C-terminal-related transcriptional regulator [Rhodocytophaga rosea]QHT69948.1 GAF domain-containing protein [Rhodocytophaga rosea]